MSPARFDVTLSRQDEARIAEKALGAVAMLRKGAYLGAQLGLTEALSILERAILTKEDGGEEHGNGNRSQEE